MAPYSRPHGSLSFSSSPAVHSAASTFFAIPELVQLLGAFLTSRDLACFRTTCKSLNKAYHHLFWRVVNFFEGTHINQPNSKSIRFLDSVPAIRAFAANLNHIKSLTCDGYIVVHYTLGVCVLFDTEQYLLRYQQPPPHSSSLPSSGLSFMKESSQEYMQELTTEVRDLIATSVLPGQEPPIRPEWMYGSFKGNSIGQPFGVFVLPQIYAANERMIFPPMTNLTRFECSFLGMQPTDWRSRPCRFPTSNKSMTMSLCWLLYFNKGLEYIKVDGIDLTTTRPVRLMAWTLSGLAHLKLLELSSLDQTKDHVGEYLLFYCSDTLESFQLKAEIESSSRTHPVVISPWYDLTQTDEYFYIDVSPNWMSDSFHGDIEIPRRPMPLLKSLRMPAKPLLGYTNELCPVLENCPALESWHLPTVGRHSFDVGETLAIIKELQLPLKRLTVDYPRQHDALYRIPGSIMDALAPHTLESFSISCFEDDLTSSLTSRFSRHSATLCEINFDAVEELYSSTIENILTSCHALEKLVVRRGSKSDDPNEIDLLKDASLTIYDATTKPWVCLGLKHLEIPVQLHWLSPSIALPEVGSKVWCHNWLHTQDDKDWECLRKFYTQIGALHRLEVLDLKACMVYLEAPKGFKTTCYYLSLPGMLLMPPPPPNAHTSPALHKKKYPVPGFLDLLGGLTQLRELRGSVRVDLPAMVATMRLDSYRWIGRHWPKLKVAEFLLPGYQAQNVYHLPPHITWLFTERPFLKLSADFKPQKKPAEPAATS
ncbi:hypothetical protein EC991_006576 [Linnemannia zychae]|nr:hypothetical protein EC991_006576 [Linnemannia zychae]